MVACSAAFLLNTPAAFSQTVWVKVGESESGVPYYIEAFEYDAVSEKPSFPGGEMKLTEFINAQRCYPPEAYARGIEGRVTCSFIINIDGSVSNIRLLRSANQLLNQEALRIFSLMPDWVPGRDIDGKPVPVRVVRTVRFKK